MNSWRILAHSMHNWEGDIPSVTLMVQVIGIVMVIVAMAYAYSHFRQKSGRMKFGKSVKKLTILETKSLGGRQYLAVVAYESEKFLLGIHPNGIQFLSKLADKTENKNEHIG